MPLAFSLDQMQTYGKRRHVSGQVTFDNSYLTNGEPFTAADLGLSMLEHVQVESSAGYVVNWNRSVTAPTLIAFQQSAATGALTEVPNTTNLSTVVCEFSASGY